MSYLKTDQAERGREAAAEQARGQRSQGYKRTPQYAVDTSRRWCSCASAWSNGEGGCTYCGKPITRSAA